MGSGGMPPRNFCTFSVLFICNLVQSRLEATNNIPYLTFQKGRKYHGHAERLTFLSLHIKGNIIIFPDHLEPCHTHWGYLITPIPHPTVAKMSQIWIIYLLINNFSFFYILAIILFFNSKSINIFKFKYTV